jgi:hypothetical protein
MCPVSKHRIKKSKKKKPNRQVGKKNMVNFICLDCDMHEEIPLTVVQDFDAMDLGDEGRGTTLLVRRMWRRNVP